MRRNAGMKGLIKFIPANCVELIQPILRGHSVHHRRLLRPEIPRNFTTNPRIADINAIGGQFSHYRCHTRNHSLLRSQV
jgi:hypothetical protein